MLKMLGVKFKLNILFLLILFLFSISGLFLTASINFIIVILHELAHSLMAQKEGVRVNEIELLPFGGVAKFRDLIQLKPKSEIKISLAGPIFNLVLAGITLILLRYKIIPLKSGFYFIKVNLTIGLFNLIPALPLDGGRVVRAFLTNKVGFKEATYYTLRLSRVIAIFLGVIGVIGIYYGYANIILLFIAFFIYFATLKEGRYASYVLMQYIAKKRGNLLKERVIYIQQLIAVEDTPLKEIVERLVPNRFHTIRVVDNDMKLLGVVTEDKFINSLVNEGIEMPIKDLLK